IELRSPTPRLFFSTEEASSNPSSKVQQSLFSDFPPPNQLSPPPEALGKKRKGLKNIRHSCTLLPSKGFTEPLSGKLLPDLHPSEQNVLHTPVIDLNENLIYTDWKRKRGWRTFKRPGVDAFLEHLSKFYEIVVYSDQMEMYVGPVCEKLDPNGYIRYKLARGATKYGNGNPPAAGSVKAQQRPQEDFPENCVPIKSYKLESDDTVLVDLIPFLEYVARNGPADIRPVLASYERKDVAKEFLE
uniref:Mitochondrial import inner membrane translocase subunit TIM50 n=1 Tax=Brassica oleracea var. oleracea TaxID=109376 RepID=A0A0D3CR41_BRAOL